LVQEKFIFKPEKLPQDFKYVYEAPFEELFFDVAEGVRINGLHFFVKNQRDLSFTSMATLEASRAGLSSARLLSISIRCGLS